MKNQPVYLTCALCHHFDSNRNRCTLYNRDTFAVNQAYADTCKSNGAFTREFTVQYSISNYYKDGDVIPNAYIENLMNLSKDKNDVPLFVLTKRGIERALPAYEGLELVSDSLMGVKREYTYQGQREIIYEYGEKLAAQVCSALNIQLVVLPGEEGSEGSESFKGFANIYHGKKSQYGGI